MNYENPNLADSLAAEYVLGTLEGRARQRFEGLLQAHPSLRARVREWEQRLNPLAAAAAPVKPPAAAWNGLQQRLFPEPPPEPWYRRLAPWRNLALGSSMLAATLAVIMLVAPPIFQDDSSSYVVLMNDNASQQPAWMISTSGNMDQFFVKNLQPMEMPPGRQCMLWLQPKGSRQLYPLGVLPDQGDAATLKLEEKMRAMLPGQLTVTVEEKSETLPAAPSGPALYRSEWLPVESI